MAVVVVLVKLGIHVYIYNFSRKKHSIGHVKKNAITSKFYMFSNPVKCH